MAAPGGLLDDPVVVIGDTDSIADISDGGVQKRGSKRWLMLALLLLLLLCSITTIVDTWMSRGPDQARFVTRNLDCLQCHTELIPDMSQASVHNPFLLKECTVCHTPHGQEVERTILSGPSRTWQRARTLVEWLPLKWLLTSYDSITGVTTTEGGGKVKSVKTEKVKGNDSNLVAPADELCWICHGNLGYKLSEAYQHNPFGQGYCVTCHDPHSSQYRGLLKQDERDLCVTCHPVAAEMARDQVHPPFEGRFCTNCHDPHASEWKGILVTNQRDLCFTCHPSVAPLSLKAVQHQPFEYDNCTGCHEPHGSNITPLLLEDQPNLCYRCHGEIKTDFLKPSHHPVDTVKLDCADCHNPHATDYAALLVARDNKLCYTCHSDYPKKATYDSSAHSQGKVLCIGCHTPHGSQYAPILRDSNPDLCLTCHVAYDATDQNKHPVRPVYFDINAGKGLTCSSTCHDPHGTTNNYMLRQYPSPLDGNCLICHRATPGRGVGNDY
ncbi:MAG: cytochrome c3 family protein [Coriobacteriia bacterium]|nr:cytochrome c3 family protein [Coriobacteriia bacterium]